MTVTSDLDGVDLRRAFSGFPSGVVALCAEWLGERIGMAASTFVPVSLDPPLVAVCIQKTSTTWPKLRSAETLGISVLGEEHAAAARALAGKGRDRFDGLVTSRRTTGAIFVEGAAVFIESRITQEVDAGDHLIVVLSVDWLHAPEGIDPIVFHRSVFRRLDKTS
jgi:flavin reductase (DIM6/NTAB) family NADH-FMN oxidoreductase RutF